MRLTLILLASMLTTGCAGMGNMFDIGAPNNVQLRDGVTVKRQEYVMLELVEKEIKKAQLMAQSQASATAAMATRDVASLSPSGQVAAMYDQTIARIQQMVERLTAKPTSSAASAYIAQESANKRAKWDRLTSLLTAVMTNGTSIYNTRESTKVSSEYYDVLRRALDNATNGGGGSGVAGSQYFVPKICEGSSPDSQTQCHELTNGRGYVLVGEDGLPDPVTPDTTESPDQ